MSEEAKETGSPTQDERVMAAVAHATIIFSAVGLIEPLIIWGTQRGSHPFWPFRPCRPERSGLMARSSGS